MAPVRCSALGAVRLKWDTVEQRSARCDPLLLIDGLEVRGEISEIDTAVVCQCRCREVGCDFDDHNRGVAGSC